MTNGLTADLSLTLVKIDSDENNMMLMSSTSSWQPPSLDSTQFDLFVKPVARQRSTYQPQKLPPPDAAHSIIKLDQNENSIDWPRELKLRVLNHLSELDWHRYPQPYATELAAQLAEFHGLSSTSILIGHGSNSFIDLIFATMGPANHWIIVQPTFGLFTARAPFHHLSYSPWPLKSQGGFCLESLPPLQTGSCVLFASPNNPTGCVLELASLEQLLTTNPHCLFICDAAYEEYSHVSYTPLLKHHANLIILRTFSKAYSSAGLRLGYLMASPDLIATLRNFQLPFTLNHFATVVLTELLKSPYTFLQDMANHATTVAHARDQLYHQLTHLLDPARCFVYPSGANFLLLTMSNHTECQALITHLKTHQISVRNLSNTQGLTGALRISIGAATQNQACVHALSTFFNSN